MTEIDAQVDRDVDDLVGTVLQKVLCLSHVSQPVPAIDEDLICQVVQLALTFFL